MPVSTTLLEPSTQKSQREEEEDRAADMENMVHSLKNAWQDRISETIEARRAADEAQRVANVAKAAEEEAKQRYHEKLQEHYELLKEERRRR